MKRLIVLAFAILASAPAWAQWTRYYSTPPGPGKGHFELFFDPSTIRATGQMRQVWTVMNLAEPDEEGDRSARILTEVSCANRTVRRLQMTFYTGPMGTGKAGETDKNPEDGAGGEGILTDSLVRAVCQRR